MLKLLLWLFPRLHPCRRGHHQPMPIHRVRLFMLGAQSRRCVVAFVETNLACAWCDLAPNAELWAEISGPTDVPELDLAPEQWAELEAGKSVYLPPVDITGRVLD